MKKISLLVLALTTLFCAESRAENDQHFVGGDISLLPSYESYSTPYKDNSGTAISDVVTYVHDKCGWNACRVRLFVNPTERTSGTHTGVVQDLDYVKKLGKRIKDAGMKLMLDFHYSDCWADPSYQEIPASWKVNTSNEALADSVYQYTKRCLTAMKDYGAEPDFVQVGNEISYGMLRRDNSDKVYPSQDKSNCAAAWDRLCLLLNKGSKAVREVCPDAKIVIHTERSGQTSQTCNFYNYISSVDYDIIGLSYYCFYHGSLPFLKNTLNDLASKFPDKKVQIVETAYFYQYYPSDATYTYTSIWPATEAGQQKFVQELVAELLNHDNVNGLYYWFPEENGNGGASWNASKIVIDSWLNRGLWDDNSHKALKALYDLKALCANDAAIQAIENDEEKTNEIYNLDGQRMDKELEDLPHGFYILGGRKIIK